MLLAVRQGSPSLALCCRFEAAIQVFAAAVFGAVFLILVQKKPGAVTLAPPIQPMRVEEVGADALEIRLAGRFFSGDP